MTRFSSLLEVDVAHFPVALGGEGGEVADQRGAAGRVVQVGQIDVVRVAGGQDHAA